MAANEPTSAPIPLRPMGLGDVLDGAFKLFVANWRTMLLLAGAFLVPVQLLSAIVQRDLVDDVAGLGALQTTGDLEQFFTSGDFGQFVLASALIGLLGVVVVAVAQGGICGVAGAAMLDRPLTLGEALRLTLRRTPALLGAWVLAHLLQFGPALVGLGLVGVGAQTEMVGVVVLGVIVAIAGLVAVPFIMALFVPVAPLVVIERLGPLAAVGRSHRLVRTRYWPVLGIALLAGLVAFAVSGAFTSGPNVLSGFFSVDVQLVASAAAATVAGLVTTPFIALTSTLIYLDLRVRREGLDLARRTEDLGYGPGTAS